MSNTIDLGPLAPLMEDDSVREIMVNGHETVYVERRGELVEVPSEFRDEQHLRDIIANIFESLGREITPESPIADCRLAVGARVNVVMPPISLVGPTLTIRKFFSHRLTMDDLIGFGAISPEIAEFLRACILARLNIVVAGGTGSGKTTLFNELLGFIPENERIITVENAAELQFQHKHLIRLESRPADNKGEGEVTIESLVVNSLRMRPDRIIIGEVRSGEAIHVFQAMRTGHDGAMFTMYANSPRDALSRLETMATMSGFDLPLLTVRDMMAGAIDVIVHIQRMQDGRRKILFVTEIVGMQGSEIETQDIFEFVQTGKEDGKITGYHTPTGNIPSLIERIKGAGGEFPEDFFTPKE